MRFLLLLVLSSCSTSNLPAGCEARCTGGGSGRPPTAIQCLSENPARCMAARGGLQPHCDDGTPISILLCQNDGHAKCKNGAEPMCIAP